jgi:hypothetical protein
MGSLSSSSIEESRNSWFGESGLVGGESAMVVCYYSAILAVEFEYWHYKIQINSHWYLYWKLKVEQKFVGIHTTVLKYIFTNSHSS